MPDNPCMSVVVPVYNEEESLPKFLAEMHKVLPAVTERYEIIFAADPCKDRTIEIIREASDKDPRIKLLMFSRRFGQPAATMAG